MLRLEGGGPILNIEVGRFRVSKSRSARQGAPQPGFPELLTISISYDRPRFPEPSPNGQPGLQLRPCPREIGQRCAFGARPFDSSPVMIDPAARVAGASVNAFDGLRGSRNFERCTVDFQPRSEIDSSLNLRSQSKRSALGAWRGTMFHVSCPCGFYRPKCSAPFLRELTGRER